MTSGIAVGEIGLGPHVGGLQLTRGEKEEAVSKKRFVEKYRSEIGTLNKWSNGIGSSVNFLTFLTGNILPDSSIQEHLEKLSSICTRVAKGIQGTIGAIDCTEKRNAFPLLGNALEIVVSLFVNDDYNRWRLRGPAQGLAQFLKVFEQRAVKEDENGNPVPNENGKVEFVGGDFSEVGFVKGFTSVCKEIPKMLKELGKEPLKRMKQFSHSTLLFSLFMIAGGISTFFGLDKIGATLRDLGGSAVDFTFMLEKDIKTDEQNQTNNDNNESNKQFKFMGKSTLFWAGVSWIWASVFDFLKIIPFFSDNVRNLTHLSQTSDLGASILFTQSNLEATNKASVS